MNRDDIGRIVTINFPPGTEYTTGWTTPRYDIGLIVEVDASDPKGVCRVRDSRGNTLEIPQEWCEVWTDNPPATLSTGLRG